MKRVSPAVVAASALLLSVVPLRAATYTWHGYADEDWNNPWNWSFFDVPWDTDPSTATLETSGASFDRIVFENYNVLSMPTLNVPAFGGGGTFNSSRQTPEVDLITGSLTIQLRDQASSVTPSGIARAPGMPWLTTVGDGILDNGTASLTYVGNSFSFGLNRGGSGPIRFEVQQDGELNFRPNLPITVLSSSFSLAVEFTLNGGAVNFSGPLQLVRASIAPGASYFDFTSEGSRVTAAYGLAFTSVGAVSNRIGTTFRSSTGLLLRATDNANGTFSVIVVPEPATVTLCGLGLLAGLRRRR